MKLTTKCLTTVNNEEERKTINSIKSNKTILSRKAKTMAKSSGFLNDHEIKEIEIKNPRVREMINECDGYGPYYSKCPVCNNKNLSYFKDLKTDDAVKVLKYIKKSKVENIEQFIF
jgi:DNA repair exonuclease SbcCD ATPase subunit